MTMIASATSNRLEIPAVVEIPTPADTNVGHASSHGGSNINSIVSHDTERIEVSGSPTKIRMPRKCRTWSASNGEVDGYLLVLQDELDVSSLGDGDNNNEELEDDDDGDDNNDNQSFHRRSVRPRKKSMPRTCFSEGNAARLNEFVETNSQAAGSRRTALARKPSSTLLVRIPSRLDFSSSNNNTDDHTELSRTPSRRSLCRTTSFRCPSETNNRDDQTDLSRTHSRRSLCRTTPFLCPSEMSSTADETTQGSVMQRSRFGRFPGPQGSSSRRRLPPKAHSMGANPPRKPTRFRSSNEEEEGDIRTSRWH